MGDRIKNKVQEKFSVSEFVYHTTVSILIGIGIGLVLLGFVAFVTRDSRPTQYLFLYIEEKLGIELYDSTTINNSNSL